MIGPATRRSTIPRKVTDMDFDFNGVRPPSRSLIPDGTCAKVIMTLIPGGIDGSCPLDRGLLLAAKDTSSDYVMLEARFSLTEWPHSGSQFWQKFGVRGGERNESGAFKCWLRSQALFRAMIDSAYGLDSDDYSEAARRKRVLGGLAELDQLSFVARIKIQHSTNPAFAATNKIDAVIQRSMPEWQKIMAGEIVQPQPSRTQPNREPKAQNSADHPYDVDADDFPF